MAWAGDDAGSGEYRAESADVFRPGGRMVQVPLKSFTNHWDISGVDEETHWVTGYRDSAMSIMASMVNWCHAESIWPEPFKMQSVWQATQPVKVSSFTFGTFFSTTALRHLYLLTPHTTILMRQAPR
jgi:hypothetical protein